MKKTPRKFIIDDPFKDFGFEIPRPKSFPISFDEMLRCLMPQVETKDERRKRFFDSLQDTKSGKQKIQFGEAFGWLEEMKSKKYDDFIYCLYAQDFLRWWEKGLTKKRSEIGSKGGRPKKPLEDEKSG